MKKLLGSALVLLGAIFVSCNNQEINNESDDYKLSVVAPSGAPAVALADMATKYSSDYEFTFGLDADGLKVALTTMDTDVVIAPVNLGANIYSKNECYKLTAVVTWGNLFFASQSPINLEDVATRKYIPFGDGTVNGVIVDYVLNSLNVTFGERVTPSLAQTSDTAGELAKSSDAICLVAEPVLSATETQLKAQGKEVYKVSVQDLYAQVSGSNSYPQAGCFVKSSTIDAHKNVVDGFLTKLEASCVSANTDTNTVAEEAKALSIFANAVVLAKAIPNSNISFKKASLVKADVEAVANLKLQLFGGALPKDEFYYA